MKKPREINLTNRPKGYCRTGQNGNIALKEKAESRNLYTSESLNLKKFLASDS